MSDDPPSKDNTADDANTGAAENARRDTAPEADAAASAESGAADRPSPLRLPTLLAVAALLYALDLLTKTLAVAKLTPGDPVSIIGDFARLSLVRNPGAAFSMATGMTWLLTLVAAAVVIGVIRIGRTLRSLWWAIGLGMVLGGALGNLTDRLFRAPGPLQGHVVDFVAIGWWPVFNVADSTIVCGAVLLVALTVFGFEPDGTRAGRRSTDEPAADTASSGTPASGTPAREPGGDDETGTDGKTETGGRAEAGDKVAGGGREHAA